MNRPSIPKIAAVLASLSLLSATPSFAHHSFASEFDIQKPIRIVGKVTKITIGNPHGSLDVSVANSSGGTVSWHVELPSANDVNLGGLRSGTIPVGAEVAVGGYVAKSGDPIVGASAITVTATGWSMAIPVERSWLFDPVGERFSAGDSVQLTGKVVSVERVNPVPTVRIAVTTAGASTQDWIVETAPTTTLDQVGWTAASLISGDVIQVGGKAAMSGSKRVFATKIAVIEKSGKTLISPLALLNSTPLK